MDLINNRNEYIMKRNSNLELKTNSIPQSLVEQLANSMSKNTKRAYLNDIKHFFEIDDLSQLTLEMVRNVNVATANQYFLRMKEEGYANSTINRKMQALSKLYKFLCRREVGIMNYNPFSSDEGSARLKVKRYSNTRSLTDEEVKRFMETISKDRTITGIRNRIISLLLVTTGMRRAEIANLKIGQISKNMGSHVIEFEGKGNNERIVVIAEPIKRLLDHYLHLRGLSYKDKDMPLFVSHSTNADPTKSITTETIYQLVKKTAKEANLEADTISPHCFRHTYITKSLELGCALEDVQDRVGHADMSTTRRYDHTARILRDNPAELLAEMYDI